MVIQYLFYPALFFCRKLESWAFLSTLLGQRGKIWIEKESDSIINLVLTF